MVHKESVMKKAIFLACVAFFIFAGTAQPFTDGHSLVSGIVNDYSKDSITIDYTKYVLSPRCKFEIEYKVGRAFYLKRARLYDLSRGTPVSAVKIANTVTEVKIERWRR
jgi:hypothetical protein